MKKTLFLSMAILVSGIIFAQNPAISSKYSDSEITALIQKYKTSHDRDFYATGVLQQRFLQDFPKARDVSWDTNDELYEVDFDMGFRDFAAIYDKDGNLLMYKQKIRLAELPAVVKTSAEAQYPKYNFEDIEKIRMGMQTLYEVEMEYREAEAKMLITSEGKFITARFDY